MKNVKCVIGANFGDESKGLMTDYFASCSKNAIVVLHNGGAQRGHTVISPEGYRHVFRHFGSGTYAGAATYMANTFLVNPILFRREWEELAKHNIKPEVYINPNCKLTTIYDMLINQVLEFDRGASKHGSCGVGIFETLFRNQDAGVDFKKSIQKKTSSGIIIGEHKGEDCLNFISRRFSMTVGEFHLMSIRGKIDFLNYIRHEYVPKRFDFFGLKNIDASFIQVLESDSAIANFIDDFGFMMRNSKPVEDDVLLGFDDVIFEGGQGLLLDQNNIEYYPYLTPSNTGMKNPARILNGLRYTEPVEACYVTRTYMTRHGAGRFDTECPKASINASMIDLTNVPNPFQDKLRYGHLNVSELKERCLKDSAMAGAGSFYIIPVLAVTHVNEYNNDFIEAKYYSGTPTREGIYQIAAYQLANSIK